MADVAVRVCFSGRVQGVGFRYTAVQLSRDLEVGGTVRNLPDGRVELVVEGSRGDTATLIERLREHFGSAIRKVEQGNVAPEGRPRGVRVAY